MMEGPKKLLKKVNRKKALFLKNESSDVKFQEEPSSHVFIGNGGLGSGVCRELLLELFTSQLGRHHESHIKHLYLPPGKDYAFATFSNSVTATNAVKKLNGICIQTAVEAQSDSLKRYCSPALVSGPPLHLYLCFVEKIPSYLVDLESPRHFLPPGLVHVAEYISPAEEEALLDYFTISKHTQPINTSHSASVTDYSLTEDSGTPHRGDSTEHTQGVVHQPPEASLKHRLVKHYGYEFLYGSNNVDPDTPLPGGLPDICVPILRRMVDTGLIEEMPDQLTVNQYLPGAGIPPHVDTHSAFKRDIISLSLGSQVVMEFRHPDGRKVPVFLPRRSLLVMNGEARYVWSHGIASRKVDEVHTSMVGYQSSTSDAEAGHSHSAVSTLLSRGTRMSLTFRKIREKPCLCDCGYPLNCDTQRT